MALLAVQLQWLAFAIALRTLVHSFLNINFGHLFIGLILSTASPIQHTNEGLDEGILVQDPLNELTKL